MKIGCIRENRLSERPAQFEWPLVTRLLGLGLDVGLAGEVLFVGTDAEIDTSNVHGRVGKMGLHNLAYEKIRGQEPYTRCQLAMLFLSSYLGCRTVVRGGPAYRQS